MGTFSVYSVFFLLVILLYLNTVVSEPQANIQDSSPALPFQTLVRSSNGGWILAKITFSSESGAWLYINGRKAGSSLIRGRYVTISRKVRRGDVITLMGRGRGKTSGIIMDAFYNSRHYPSGAGFWKTHKFMPSWKSKWRRKSFSSCTWRRAKIISTSSITAVRGFPFRSTRAKYVWSDRWAGKGTNFVIFRHVIGGERCKRRPLKWLNMATIRFSADDRAWLFINGRLAGTNLRPGRFTTVKRTVKRGDVIAIGAKNFRGTYGVIADVHYRNRHYSTASRYWKVHKQVSSWGRRWLSKSFSSCTWGKGVVISRTSGVKRAKGFPYQSTGASYIWASPRGFGSLKSVHLRFVVGGEKCRRRPRDPMATIRFSGDDLSWLYINGGLVSRTKNPKRFVMIRRRLKRGDVVSVGARNLGRGYGFVADVFYRGRHFATGSRYWKATTYVPSLGAKWRFKRFSSCAWPRAIVVGRRNRFIKAIGFPYRSTGAKYVWAARAGGKVGKLVVLRFVVGGEKCSNGGGNKIGVDSAKRTCRCKIAVGRKGICWQLNSPTRRFGRCTSRVCEAKYECVANGDKANKICIRRIATEKIVPTSRPGHCRKIEVRTEFYVPYQ